MALFSKSDIEKSKYIIAIVGDIAAGNKIRVSNGKTFLNVKFEYNNKIKELEKYQTEPNKYKKIIYPKNEHAPIFTCKEGLFKFIQIDKSPYSKMGGSRNSLGKKLADAGELATVKSLKEDVKTAADTDQELFINNPDAFSAWLNTFLYTKVAVKKIVQNLKSFDIIHDATDNSDFTKTINNFCKKVKIAKDSWNPSDIFIIKNSKRNIILKELSYIVDNFDQSDGLIDMFNQKIYKYYKDNLLYHISLKQLRSRNPNIEYNNIPGKLKISHYDIKISNFNINLSDEGKEIGLFTFSNESTNKKISLQVRGFPHSYGIAQTEITSDGTPTGGRLGKISTNIIDKIMSEYKDERISSINFFGRSPEVFSAFDVSRMKEVYSWYKEVIKHSKVKNQNNISYNDFENLIGMAKANYSIAENLCMKIQGLKMMHFFISNEKNISDIMNKMINGAKKISNDNGFFIKVY